MLPIVATFTFVAVVMAAFVIDVGGLRGEKREVTLSTDAASLAAAAVANTEDSDLTSVANGTEKSCSLISQNSDGDPAKSVQAVVDEYLSNNGDSDFVRCVVVRTGFREGYVAVTASDDVEYTFGPVVGLDSGTASGVSVAAIQSNPGGGLRPIGACNLTSSLDNPPYSIPGLLAESGADPNVTLNGGAGYVVTFPQEKLKNSTQGCGNPSGNFGQIDLANDGNFSGSCNKEGAFCYMMANGWFGDVLNPTNGDPGNNYNSSTGAMDDLIASGQKFWVPVYSNAVKDKGKTKFTFTHFMEVQFVDYCVKQNCRITHTDGDKYQYFRWRVFRFAPYALEGPPQTADASASPPRICAVTDNASDINAGCK